MDVGAMGGIVGSVAGTGRAQRANSENTRETQDVNNQVREAAAEKKAEAAADVGETDADDQNANERDADGRRLWEESAKGKSKSAQKSDDDTPTAPPLSKDPRGEMGARLDLTA